MTTAATHAPATCLREVPRARVIGLWVLSGVILLTAIGAPPVTRTQEARVLETARQMLGSGVQGWLIPHLNGEPRLKKPPLAYWLAAIAFSVGDVSEGVGRVPTAITGWLTLALVYRFAREAFTQRVALASCAALLGSMMFYRFTRLAETDPLATFFITAAVYALWRSRLGRPVLWLHLAAAASAMVILAKGAPAVFVGLFFVAMCWIEMRFDLLRRFFTHGAILTLLVLAVPWFIHVQQQQGGGVFVAELKNSSTGGDHFDWPWVYIPGLLLACAPWVAVLPFILVRRDRSVRIVLAWLLAILVPLCINGNKQNHYLVMLTPPLMILIGVFLADRPARFDAWASAIVLGMALTSLAGAVAAPVVASNLRGQPLPVDWAVAAALGCAGVIVILLWRHSVTTATAALLAAVCLAMPLISGVWAPSLEARNVRDLAADIRAKAGDGPYVFYGADVSLPLCFQLRRAILLVRPGEAIPAGSVAIVPVKRDRPVPDPPPMPFVSLGRLESTGQTVELFAEMKIQP